MGIPGSANLLLLGGGEQAYQIDQSLRFRGGQKLTFTPSSNGNKRTFTISFWVKTVETQTVASDGNTVYSAYTSGFGSANVYYLRRVNTRGKHFLNQGTNSSAGTFITDGIYADPGAWYHVLVKYDFTNSTAADRMILYINNERVTVNTTAANVNADSSFNTSGTPIVIGEYANSRKLNGYLAEFHSVDGTVLEPTDFGEFDDNGVWRPIGYTGSYGTNGFYLTFDPTATNGIGHDHSGNGNNFTASGFDTTNSTAATYDVMSDTPTNNFATVSPLNINVQNVLSDGNLTLNLNSSVAYKPTSTIAIPSSGKFYFEGTIQGGNSQTAPDRAHYFGLNESFPSSFSAKLIGWFSQNSPQIFTGSGSSSGASGSGFVNGDVLQCAVDATTGKVWMGRNNTWYSTAANSNGDPAGGTNESATLVAGTQYHSFTSLGLDSGVTGGYYINFGQRPFAYTPPSGFKTLSTANLPAPDIADGSDYFNTVLYTGTANSPGSTQSVSGVGFAPDLVWIKRRENANSHHWTDIVRGAAKYIQSNAADAEVTTNVSGNLSSFDSDGFTCTYGSSVGSLTCQNGGSYVAWNWDAGGSGSSNTSGSITSTVSANPSAGFSIATYTGNGTAGATIGHGLGVAPKMIIVKQRSGATDWQIGHQDIGWTKTLYFTLATATTETGAWNNTAPTSTVFSVGTSRANTSSATYVAYCFAEVEGYSKIGMYHGNSSSDGVFVYTGFTPSFIMIKGDLGQDWFISDVKRNTYNVGGKWLRPNLSNAEVDDPATNGAGHDILSNGFKIRTDTFGLNRDYDYYYIAFASNPFGGSGVSPATAR
jgi:hypothetical protein